MTRLALLFSLAVAGCACASGRDTTVVRSPLKTNVPRAYLPCDFEYDGWCPEAWTITSDSIFSWNHFQGKTIWTTLGGGPPFDHTLGTWDGHYLAATFKRTDSGRKSRYESTAYQADSKQCLSFFYYYFAYGDIQGKLSVLVNGGQPARETWLWRRTSPDEGKMWMMGQVELPKTDALQSVIFEVVAGSGVGDFALDDIEVRDGACHEDLNSCDFEDGPCNFNTDFSEHNDQSVMSWHVVTPNEQSGMSGGPAKDVTTGDYMGHYLVAYRSITANHTKAVVETTTYLASAEPRCFQFFYSIYTPQDTLRVTFGTDAPFTMPVTSDSSTWKLFSMELSAGSTFSVKFTAELNEKSNIAIDDVKLNKGACR